MTDAFWTNRFHWCALAAGFIAASEDRLDDSLYVRDLAYRMFEEGAFLDRVSLPGPEREREAKLNWLRQEIQKGLDSGSAAAAEIGHYRRDGV